MNRKIPFILFGDGLKAGQMKIDCETHISHIDVFPSIMDYLRLPIDKDWDLDGRSRLEWALSPAQECDLSKTKPAIALSGGYIFDTHDADTNIHMAQDQCLSRTTSTGMFHYDIHSPCIGRGSSATVEQAPKLCSEDPLC